MFEMTGTNNLVEGEKEQRQTAVPEGHNFKYSNQRRSPGKVTREQKLEGGAGKGLRMAKEAEL